MQDSWKDNLASEFRKVRSSQLTVFYVKIGQLWYDDYKFETALRLLPFDQQTRIISKRFQDDQRTALANQLLQRFVCSCLQATPIPSLRFTTGKYGKPQLIDSPFQFSMSNQRGYTSMVVSDKECGIDLASCSDVDQFGDGYLDHFRDIFHEQEFKCLRSVESAAELKNIFTHYWALKESYTKKLGIGLNGNLASYNFRNVDKLHCDEEFISTQTVLKVRKAPQWNCNIQLSICGDDEKISIWSSMIDQQIVVAICQDESSNVPKLVEIDLETIVRFLST